MERAEVLLEKLREQFKQKADRSQLLVTLQLLHAEIMGLQNITQHEPALKKISVIVPGMHNLGQSLHAESPAIDQTAEKIIQVLQVDQNEIEAELAALKKSAELKNGLSLNGRPMQEDFSDPLDEIPTMATHHAYLPQESVLIDIKATDINQQVSVEEASFNDLHKTAKTELADRLQDSPVKDLKKAIGINDRYLYINELFNGNEAMFERTLKTLNSFSILPEAEFWIQRELKLKMGWKEENPLVHQFIQLVKRRFS
ncbi:MAG: hypothetical protein ACRC2O_17195 [Chitinophagaceae bacterium]